MQKINLGLLITLSEYLVGIYILKWVTDNHLIIWQTLVKNEMKSAL